MRYNWQQNDWPAFRYDLSGLEDVLFTFAERTGRASGLFKGLTADAQVETTIEIMVVEALKTSAIEGELLSRKDVMSSIRHNLGMESGPAVEDKRANGAAALMIDVRKEQWNMILGQGVAFDFIPVHEAVLDQIRKIQDRIPSHGPRLF
jgi:Fic family protein